MRLGVVVGIGLIFALAGCGAEETVEVVAPAAPSSTATAIDCGAAVLGQGEQISDSLADCFLKGVAADDPVSLEVSFPTTEGDPIVQTYRHLGAGRVQVVTDSTRTVSVPGRSGPRSAPGRSARPSRSLFRTVSDCVRRVF